MSRFRHRVIGRTATRALAIALLALAWPHPSAAQDVPSGPLHVASLTVEGTHRLAADDVAALTGIRPNDTVTKADLERAAQHLIATGLFTGVRYHAVRDGDRANVTFVIGEAPTSLPVIFDNLVWFTDAQIRAA